MMPSIAPTINYCETAFAHCPGHSTCLLDEYSNEWGWNIDLRNATFPLVCPIYVGATDCDYQVTGTHVGVVTITPEKVEYSFLDKMGGSSFHVYGGPCPVCDGGKHLTTGFCETEDMNSHARDPVGYPLITREQHPHMSKFHFSSTNFQEHLNVNYYQYNPFPLNQFMIAQAKVCPCGKEPCGIMPEESEPPSVIETPARRSLTTAPTNSSVPAGASPRTPSSATPSSAAAPVMVNTTQEEECISCQTIVENEECHVAYAYCNKRSKCFHNGKYESAWGWNVDVAESLAPGESISCDLYIGALSCDREKGGKLVGQLAVNSTSVRWDLGFGWTGKDYALYTGKCPANDMGEHLDADSEGLCSDTAMTIGMRMPSQYTLHGNCDGVFDVENYQDHLTEQWSNYKAFPIGSTGWQYFSAYAMVCNPHPELTAPPTAVPVGPTSAPSVETTSPTAKPTSAATTYEPTRDPTSEPTTEPTASPSSKPTEAPTAVPTSVPTVATIAPTTTKEDETCSPTPKQTTITDCQTAYAYCPDISACFFDGEYESAWGWNVNVSGLFPADEKLSCPIYVGATSCDLGAGTVVGQVVMNATSIQYNFNTGWVMEETSFYAGACAANDMAEHLGANSNGTCDEMSMTIGMRMPDQYTLSATTTSVFDTVNYNDHLTDPWLEHDYHAFPIGVGGWNYVSAYTKVCRVESEAGSRTRTSATDGATRQLDQ
jgi:hypothetical protein